jgi:hypothetical protein
MKISNYTQAGKNFPPLLRRKLPADAMIRKKKLNRQALQAICKLFHVTLSA